MQHVYEQFALGGANRLDRLGVHAHTSGDDYGYDKYSGHCVHNNAGLGVNCVC
jgi:hypothetical protein